LSWEEKQLFDKKKKELYLENICKMSLILFVDMKKKKFFKKRTF